MASHRTVPLVLAAAVATGGTFTVGYPAGTDRSTFIRGTKHRMVALQNRYLAPAGLGVSLGGTSATVTYRGATTLPIGTEVFFEFDTGVASYREVPAHGLPPRTEEVHPVIVNLGNPITADADGIFASASITAAAPITAMTGALAVGGAVVLDSPRNVVAAWTNTAVMTVTGTDEFGNVMVESSGSGTSMTGAKAFRTVTRIAVSANVTGATVGTGTVLGLPFRLPGTGHVIRELVDNAAPTAGTVVAGLAPATVSTATTGDVRGTYTPHASAVPDGSRAIQLVILAGDVTDRGNPQFAG